MKMSVIPYATIGISAIMSGAIIIVTAIAAMLLTTKKETSRSDHIFVRLIILGYILIITGFVFLILEVISWYW